MQRTLRCFLTLVCGLLTPAVQSAELRVAVAANFATTLEVLQADFERQQGHRLTLIRGSTGKLYAQILHGAPYDVFLAADSRRPRRLEQQGLALADSRYTYAIGTLALWSHDPSADPESRLRQGRFNRLALANPKTAPYGQAAVQVLKHMKLYDRYRERLVFGENIAQAFQFVQSGNADLGFVALSHVNGQDARYWLPAKDLYVALEQQLVILASSNQQPAARAFVEFLKSDATRQRIRQQGYDTL